jgi:DNA-binding NarL/FixJ family response regulator
VAKKPSGESVRPNGLATEVGRIAKLFGLYMVKDVEDEGKKITRLSAAGFSSSEIALMLDKKESNVRVQISQAKTRREK